MITLDQIKEKIEAAIPGSKAQILDPRKDGVHLKAVVIAQAFKEKSLLEQHRMVMQAVQEELNSGELHALAIETRVEE